MSALDSIVPARMDGKDLEGAAYCRVCRTYMHEGNAAAHARRHDTEDALRAAEKRVLEAVTVARLSRVGPNLNIHVIPNDVDQALIAHAELERRKAQAAYDEARK